MAAACLKFPCRAFPAAAVVVAMASDLVGKAAPDFEIELEDGSKKKLSEFLAEGHRGHLRTNKFRSKNLHILDDGVVALDFFFDNEAG